MRLTQAIRRKLLEKQADKLLKQKGIDRLGSPEEYQSLIHQVVEETLNLGQDRVDPNFVISYFELPRNVQRSYDREKTKSPEEKEKETKKTKQSKIKRYLKNTALAVSLTLTTADTNDPHQNLEEIESLTGPTEFINTIKESDDNLYVIKLAHAITEQVNDLFGENISSTVLQRFFQELIQESGQSSIVINEIKKRKVAKIYKTKLTSANGGAFLEEQKIVLSESLSGEELITTLKHELNHYYFQNKKEEKNIFIREGATEYITHIDEENTILENVSYKKFTYEAFIIELMNENLIEIYTTEQNDTKVDFEVPQNTFIQKLKNIIQSSKPNSLRQHLAIAFAFDLLKVKRITEEQLIDLIPENYQYAEEIKANKRPEIYSAFTGEISDEEYATYHNASNELGRLLDKIKDQKSDLEMSEADIYLLLNALAQLLMIINYLTSVVFSDRRLMNKIKKYREISKKNDSKKVSLIAQCPRLITLFNNSILLGDYMSDLHKEFKILENSDLKLPYAREVQQTLVQATVGMMLYNMYKYIAMQSASGIGVFANEGNQIMVSTVVSLMYLKWLLKQRKNKQFINKRAGIIQNELDLLVKKLEEQTQIAEFKIPIPEKQDDVISIELNNRGHLVITKSDDTKKIYYTPFSITPEKEDSELEETKGINLEDIIVWERPEMAFEVEEEQLPSQEEHEISVMIPQIPDREKVNAKIKTIIKKEPKGVTINTTKTNFDNKREIREYAPGDDTRWIIHRISYRDKTYVNAPKHEIIHTHTVKISINEMIFNSANWQEKIIEQLTYLAMVRNAKINLILTVEKDKTRENYQAHIKNFKIADIYDLIFRVCIHSSPKPKTSIYNGHKVSARRITAKQEPKQDRYQASDITFGYPNDKRIFIQRERITILPVS